MLKVVSFNILCGDAANGNSIAERAPRVKTFIDKYDPDLVGFQEATPKWMPYLEADYGEKYEIFNHYRKFNNKEGTPIMWKKDRFECLDKGYFWLSDTPDIESGGWCTWGCYRICLWAKLMDKQDGTVFAFFNTHFGFGDENQVKSSKLITDHVKAINTEAAIVTGDFNMFPNSDPHKKITEVLVDVNGATVNDRRNTCHGFANHPNPYHIDYCFVTPKTVEPLTFKIMDELVDGMYASDHYGVYAELELHRALSLITYNVKNCGNEPEARAQQLRGLLRQYDADLIGLQEVTPTFEEQLKKLSGYELFLQYRTEDQKEATPILWKKDKFDVVHQEYFWLSETPEVPGKGFGAQYVRIANLLVLQYKGSERKLCLLNTHLDAGEAGVKAIEFIKEKLAPYGEMPILVTADFNMLLGSPGYKAMTEQFKDVRCEVAPFDLNPTTNDFGACVPARIIDYVFTNGQGVTPNSYKVMTERHKGKYISDHFGIYTTFIVE